MDLDIGHALRESVSDAGRTTSYFRLVRRRRVAQLTDIKTFERHFYGALQPIIGRISCLGAEEMKRIGVSGTRRSVCETTVRQKAVQQDERSLGNFQRDESILGPRLV